MSFYRTLTRRFLAPAYDRIRGTRSMRCLGELEESQWWPRDRIEDLQSQRLQHLIRYVYDRVPYYRRLMDEHGISPADIARPSDLPRLPILTKEDIRMRSPELLAEGFPHGRLLEGETGGSTGTPLCFVASREGRWTHGYARSMRALEWAGIYPGDRTCLVAKGRLPGSERASLLQSLASRLSRDTFIDCSTFTDATLPHVVERIARAKPSALRGYTSAICIIGEHIRDTGRDAPDVGVIVVGGEQLFDEQRALLRQVFGRQPFSCYSSFENFEIAMECEAHQGMHVNAEDLIVEIVDDSGRPLPPGQFGHVLVTNLHEYGMPLIRYNTDDESFVLDGACPCGRQLPRIGAVVGKTGNIIHTPSGKRLSPLTLGSSSLGPMGVRRFQFIQERVDHVTVKLVPGSGLSPNEVEALPSRVATHFGYTLGPEVEVDVQVVQSIEPTAAGKHLFLISMIGNEHT